MKSNIKNKFTALLSLDIISIALFGLYYLYYTVISMENVAWLSWYSFFPIGKKFLSNSLSFQDLLTRYCEHGMFGYNLVFLINIKLFHLNTMFDAYLNVVIVACCAIILFCAYRKSFLKEGYSVITKLFFVLISIVMFSAIQKSSGAMDTQIRLGILFFFIVAFLMDGYLINDKKENRRFFAVIIMTFISIDVFGTFYTFAWFPIILIVLLIECIKLKKADLHVISYGVSIFMGILLYLIEYNFFSKSETSAVSGGMLKGLIIIFMHPIDSFFCLVSYLGAGITGRTVLEDHLINSGLFIGIGVIVFLIYIYSLVRYKNTKMYQKTYLPIFMIGYTFFVMIMAMIGRHSSWDWGTNYWYIVHTKFGISACIWIISFDYIKTRKKYINKTIKTDVVNLLIIGLFIVGIIYGNKAELKRAPFEKAWYHAKAICLLNPETIKVDSSGNTQLCLPLKDTMEGIQFLQKYKLNLYSYPKGKPSTITFGSGWYQKDNGITWMSKEGNLKIIAGKRGLIKISCYWPEKFGPNTINIYYGDKLIVNNVKIVGSKTIVCRVKPNVSSRLILRMGKSVIPEKLGINNDERELGIAISKIKVN